jgi:mannose-1-phosphate guanylyltransferase/mannose-6-phosphate isomerase-like protein (cupin superfamily)
MTIAIACNFVIEKRGMEEVFAVILAGGAGVRFWPYSREMWPKQMLDIVGEDSLLRQTIRRLENFIPPENIFIVTTEKLAQDIKFHLDSLGPAARKIQFIKEPVGRNTAPAIGLCAVYLHHFHPESIMVVMPSDHAIPDRDAFLGDLRWAVEGARRNGLVTFGIKPDRPATGYGYLKRKDSTESGGKGLFRLERFVEKPDFETARKYLSEKNYFWNSGIFVWKTATILTEIEKQLPNLYKTLKEIESVIFPPDTHIDKLAHELDEPNKPNKLNKPNKPDRLNELYSGLDSVSIDYGVMEKCTDVWMVLASFRWSDLGSWTALDEVMEKDDAGNIIRGNTVDIESQNSTILAGERIIATIGLKDMVVVDTPDATLVTSKGRDQEVRKIVERLKSGGREEHLLHRKVEKPWGSYTVLEKGPGYKIKRVVLKPKGRLSLQRHKRRSEHWVVISGEASVTREGEVYIVRANESTYIPTNTRHRLENPGEQPLQIIEVQNGDYVEEDDIERFDDDYGRTF